MREMRQNEIAGAGIEAIGISEVFAYCVIGEVAGAREDALLNDPRIWTHFKHVQVVIGLQDNAIAIPKVDLNVIWHVAKIRDNGHFCAVGAEREGDGIGGVVRDLEGVNINVTDDETLAGLNRFERAEALSKRVRKRAAKRVHRAFRDVKRRLPKAQHLRETVAVVGMLVGDEDAVDPVDALLDGRKPRKRFTFAEAAVHEESGPLGLEQGDVARAA